MCVSEKRVTYRDARLARSLVINTGICILAILSKLKNREEFEEGHEKRKGKGVKRRKKQKSNKTHVIIPL